jgi:hypothetical protein
MAHRHLLEPEGRIGNAALSPATDPRFNPKLVRALATQGWEANLPIGIANENSSHEELTQEMRAQHYGFSEGFANLPNDLPEDDCELSLDRKTFIAEGVDGEDIKLHLFRRSDLKDQVLPCVIYSSCSNRLKPKEEGRKLTSLQYTAAA